MVATVTCPSGVTLSAVKIGDTTVTKSGNYAYSSGTLTLKSALLSAKDNGDTAFTLHMSNGDTATITVTVGY